MKAEADPRDPLGLLVLVPEGLLEFALNRDTIPPGGLAFLRNFTPKLATAIFYATLTNIIAYLPFLLLTGNTGEFLKSLPIVMTTALLCALVVAMTFVPLLGYYIQRPPARKDWPSASTISASMTWSGVLCRAFSLPPGFFTSLGACS